MIKRTIEISSKAFLKVRLDQLIIESEGGVSGSIPIEDIGVLLLNHPAITLTQAVLIKTQKNNVALVSCDDKHMPSALTLPLNKGHSLHQKVLRTQISVKKTTHNRIWKQIVQQKIEQQAKTLTLLEKNEQPVHCLIRRVKSGDKENHEGQAARIYWPLLFGEHFTRDPDKEGINTLLNYGYAIIRAVVSRAIVSAGLHPAIGIHHSNQYNPFCLADDIMEPLRPWVDFSVYQYAQKINHLEVCRDFKTAILTMLAEKVHFDGRAVPLMVSLQYLLKRLKDIYLGEEKSLYYPKKINKGP
ncbi:type II CRISPR-associated endonuclease Cas1 [Desulfosediminicola sp.]|uniref:type II CRISPR-associated endonuclease Cas1 n=1 Tax=Desulfosediminicola sp. TaxID=2886825 RepID=UPI003AF2AD70